MAQRLSSRILPLFQSGRCALLQQLGFHGSEPFLGGQAFSSAASHYSTASAAEAKPSRCVSGSSVPEGHLQSDLTSAACHIGLNRRRDLTLRADVALWNGNSRLCLVDIFKGKKIVVVGFPGGRICSEKHIPGYIQSASEMCKLYVDGIVLVTVAREGETPADIAAPAPGSKVALLTDRNAGFMKLLGLDLAPPEAVDAGPRCQRFAAFVEDGILVKLRVEKSPGELVVSDAQSMLKLLDSLHS